MSKYYTMKQGVCPTEEQVVEARRKKHAKHLDYFYGDYWSIFEDEDHRFFVEFDVGHFASKFVVREITGDDYRALKNDKGLFDKVRRSVE